METLVDQQDANTHPSTPEPSNSSKISMEDAKEDVQLPQEPIDLAPEDIPEEENNSGELQSSDEPLIVSNVGSSLVTPAQQEAELANQTESSMKDSPPVTSATDSTINVLNNEPNTAQGLPEGSNEEIPTESSSEQHQSLKSPIVETPILPSNVDIQALLQGFAASAAEPVPSSINHNSENLATNASEPATPLIPSNGQASQSQPSTPFGDLSSLPASIQSNLTGNVPLQTSIPASTLTIGANGLPPPPNASFQHALPPSFPLPPTPGGSSRAGGSVDEDGPFPQDLEGPYEEFLRFERANMAEGNWEKFPDGSRLFIGTLC
jgi:nuclear polyadenylated RNA-binding protein 3